jgi:hypothetical protein
MMTAWNQKSVDLRLGQLANPVREGPMRSGSSPTLAASQDQASADQPPRSAR